MSDSYFHEPGSAPSRIALEGDPALEKDVFKQAFSYEHENHYLQRPASRIWLGLDAAAGSERRCHDPGRRYRHAQGS